MLLAAFCIPTVSLLKTGYAICSVLYPQCVPLDKIRHAAAHYGTTDYLLRPRISEFTNCPSVRSSRDGDAEVFVKETTNK